MTTADELYDRFHRLSLATYFKIQVLGLGELKRHSSFLQYVDTFPSETKLLVNNHYNEYCFRQSPKIKLAPLFEFLDEWKVNPQTWLDFGAGNGNCMRFIKETCAGSSVFGVEPSLEVKTNDVSIDVFSDLGAISQSTFDVIMFIHTLHHIESSLQRNILRSLKERMHRNSILFVLEDTWSETTVSDLQGEALDSLFARLPTTEKLRLFKTNEFWSNTWFYERQFDACNTHYKTSEQWQRELLDSGLEVRRRRTNGFNFQRVHGVPSGWFIARKL